MQLSFLYTGYGAQWSPLFVLDDLDVICILRYWWEVCVVARKVLLVSLAVFASDAPHVQSLLAVMLCTFALMLHVFASPFRDPVMVR
jgi:hypothetical protein